ncbi:hypothetical protein HN873_005080, partial [Arachis hypogaea]
KVESEPNSSGAGSSSDGAVEEVSVQRVKEEEVNAKISAWQNNKIAKSNNRFKRKDVVIEGWESEQTNKPYQLLSNNPIAFCLLVTWDRGNALEKCTWFKIQDSRKMYLVQVGSWDRRVKALTPMMSSLQNFRDKDDKVDELLTSPTPKASAKALPSMSELGLKRINPEQSVNFDTNPITLSYSEVVI